jgi:hypothetical protein
MDSIKTGVCYDDIGHITGTQIGTTMYTPVGIPYLVVDVPAGKTLKNIDVTVTPNQPVFEDIPKTEFQMVKDSNVQLQSMIEEMTQTVNVLLTLIASQGGM